MLNDSMLPDDPDLLAFNMDNEFGDRKYILLNKEFTLETVGSDIRHIRLWFIHLPIVGAGDQNIKLRCRSLPKAQTANSFLMMMTPRSSVAQYKCDRNAESGTPSDTESVGIRSFGNRYRSHVYFTQQTLAQMCAHNIRNTRPPLSHTRTHSPMSRNSLFGSRATMCRRMGAVCRTANAFFLSNQLKSASHLSQKCLNFSLSTFLRFNASRDRRPIQRANQNQKFKEKR